jgi:hypothetical protein
MTERVPGNATGAEVLCSEHAPRRHDADESIELWFLGILAQADVDFSQWTENNPEVSPLTLQASREFASAFDEDTSRSIPLRFCKMSRRVSKLVEGGGL